MLNRGCVFTLTSSSEAIQNKAIETLTAGMATWSSTGATTWLPWYQVYLAKAHAELGQFDEAWRNVHQAIAAIDNSNETWCEADLNRIAGEIARKSDADALKAEKYFRARTCSRASSASKILGTSRRNEPRAALA
jgi:hypothetical protein